MLYFYSHIETDLCYFVIALKIVSISTTNVSTGPFHVRQKSLNVFLIALSFVNKTFDFTAGRQ